ncbi:MAG: hypothetical protein RL693_2750 [Verrucomicrobiota bacterium]|jgi:ArsR family transcriptional regulator
MLFMPVKSRSKAPAPKPKVLSDAALEMIAARFRAYAEPMRLRLLNQLMQGEATVGQLVEATGSGQANVSKHLSILREAGLISTRKVGLSTICIISDPTVNELCEIMCRRLQQQLSDNAREFG